MVGIWTTVVAQRCFVTGYKRHYDTFWWELEIACLSMHLWADDLWKDKKENAAAAEITYFSKGWSHVFQQGVIKH